MIVSKQLPKALRNIRRLCTNIEMPHVPVMVNEVVRFLHPQKDEIIVDMTFGSGGHSRRILYEEPTVKILAVDRDPLAQSYAKQLADEFPDRVTPLLGKFSDLPQLLAEEGFGRNSIDSFLFDYGCSSMQFDLADRGFSLHKNGPLDMRMDGTSDPGMPTAADVLANASEEDLGKIIKYYGEEKQAKKVARAIVESRYLFKRLTTTEELTDLIDTVLSEELADKKRTSTARIFQALRIFVNNELNEINYGLVLAHHYLKLGGRLVTITFHSLEDTIVKRHLLGNLIENCANPLPLKFNSHNFNLEVDDVHQILSSNWKPLHKHVIVPSYEELEVNNRCRSAKLRAAVKVK